jgi:hypothetical protein
MTHGTVEEHGEKYISTHVAKAGLDEGLPSFCLPRSRLYGESLSGRALWCRMTDRPRTLAYAQALVHQIKARTTKVGFGRIVVSEREAPILLANLGGKWASSSTERQRGPSCRRLFGPLSTITKGY